MGVMIAAGRPLLLTSIPSPDVSCNTRWNVLVAAYAATSLPQSSPMGFSGDWSAGIATPSREIKVNPNGQGIRTRVSGFGFPAHWRGQLHPRAGDVRDDNDRDQDDQPDGADGGQRLHPRKQPLSKLDR